MPGGGHLGRLPGGGGRKDRGSGSAIHTVQSHGGRSVQQSGGVVQQFRGLEGRMGVRAGMRSKELAKLPMPGQDPELCLTAQRAQTGWGPQTAPDQGVKNSFQTAQGGAARAAAAS